MMDPRRRIAAALLPWLFLPAFAHGGGDAATPAAAQAQPATAAGPPVDAEDAADADADPTPGTGDPVVDARMADITVYAQRFPEAFVDELVRYFDAPRGLIEDLLGEGVDAGDLYYACALARVTGRPCRGVIDAWRGAGDAAGWEPVARRFGVEPGGERARRLRDGIADSYAHWGRPLPAD